MPAPDPVSSNACSICGETRIHHVREYTIQGRVIRMAFSDCLHSVEQIERSNGAGPKDPTPLAR